MEVKEVLQPLRDIILIQADPVEKQTASGLLLAEQWESRPPYGVVLAVGSKVESVKPGDRVMFNRFAAIDIDLTIAGIKKVGKEQSERLKFCKESHILGIENGTNS